MTDRDAIFKSLLDKPAKVGPKYSPKVTLRLTDDRTRQVVEVSLPVPKEGPSPDVLERFMTSLIPVFRRLGYLEPSCLSLPQTQSEEVDHAESEEDEGGKEGQR